VAGERKRSERAAVKTLFECDDLALAGIREPREFQRRFVRLSSAVAEKRSQQSRRAHETLAEDSLCGVIEKIRHVQQILRAVLERLHEPRMLMAEDVDGDSAEEVPIDVTISIDQSRASA
jgi:hypothetical protein